MKKLAPLASVAVRMYHTGFGDCFLLTFRYGKNENGVAQVPKTLWIDFGARSGKADRMKAIAQDIGAYLQNLHPSTGGPFVDVFAITHEHQDHISGLKQAKEVLDTFTFGQVWFAWTEDPHDPEAQSWKRQKTHVKSALYKAVHQVKLSEQALLKKDNAAKALASKRIAELEKRLKMITEFDFEGQENERDDTQNFARNPAYEALIAKVKPANVRYLEPGYTDSHGNVHPGSLIGKGVNNLANSTIFEGIKIYVLGPPKDMGVIRVGEPKNWQSTLQARATSDTCDFSDSNFAADADGQTRDFWHYVNKAPFTEEFIVPLDLTTGRLPEQVAMPAIQSRGRESDNKNSREVKGVYELLSTTEVYQRYFGPSESGTASQINDWRRIDTDYLYQADDMAIKLNTGVNNTSLVLAIEIEKTKEVLFFSGDAEFGVWDDWEKDSAKPRKMRQYVWRYEDNGKPRVVTVQDLLANTIFYKMGHHGSENATPKTRGINKLTNRSLHSMIPVDEKKATKFGWTKIPFKDILSSLDNRNIPYVRADKSIEENGGVDKAKERSLQTPLGQRVDWVTKETTPAGSHYVEWTLKVE